MKWLTVMIAAIPLAVAIPLLAMAVNTPEVQRRNDFGALAGLRKEPEQSPGSDQSPAVVDQLCRIDPCDREPGRGQHQPDRVRGVQRPAHAGQHDTIEVTIP